MKATELVSGEVRIFRSPAEAAAIIGVSDTAVRLAVKAGRPCRGWTVEQIPTVCAVRLEDGNFFLCEVAEGGGGFDILGEDGGYIQRCEVAEVWDVTENMNRVRLGRYEKK